MNKIFSKKEIEDLYRAHVQKDKSYFAPTTRKEILSLNFEYQVGSQKFIFAPEGHDYSRIKCLLEFRSWIKKHNIRG